MGLALTVTAGVGIWIILWATGIKAFDGFLITLAMVLLAATLRIVLPYLPGNRDS